MNRLSCEGKISDPIYSKDKELEVVRGGEKDLFIKVSPVMTTYNGLSEVTYGDFPRELFVECQGIIYNFTLLPTENLATQTIVIKSTLGDIKQVKKQEEATPYETLIASLIKSAYNEVAPNSYTVEKGNITYSFNELDMRLRYVYRGYNYIVEDWLATSKMDNEVELEENLFVPIIKNARAVALTSPKIKRNESSRVLVVRLALESIK